MIVDWYYGATGTGKTKAAWMKLPGAYFHAADNMKWWDGYDMQKTVIIDDFRQEKCSVAYFLKCFDRYPMRVEFKGGSPSC